MRDSDFTLTGLLAEAAGVAKDGKAIHMLARTAAQLWSKKFFKRTLQVLFNTYFEGLSLAETS